VALGGLLSPTKSSWITQSDAINAMERTQELFKSFTPKSTKATKFMDQYERKNNEVINK
jgi:hypothetical protein